MAVFLRVALICLLILTHINLVGAGAIESNGKSKSQEEVALSQAWLRLLHYQKTWLGGYRSRVDGGGFFLAQDGRNNPLSELIATVKAFSQNIQIGKYQLHPQCAFPERYRFLKEQLQLKISDEDCPKLRSYLDKINPDSATLVFSTAYPHNPGSMFGHTFLRFNSQVKNQKKQDLLDWGVSYAARVDDDENPFAFVYGGLTGGYVGQFSLLPYYAKVNEYINNESRDLWEYQLNLNRDETYRLLRNIWEVETNSYFDYYFLDENCAFQLLAFLEVAKPEWKLTDFPIYVIPGETLKKVSDIPGAIKKISYRPSLQRKVLRGFEKLTLHQQELFKKLTSFELNPESMNETELLDNASDYLLFLKKKNGDELSEGQSKLLRRILVRRSQLGTAKDPIAVGEDIPEELRPDLAHHTYKIGLAYGREFREIFQPKGQAFQELQFKFAFHDLLNSDQGYTPFSQIDFPALTLRYYQESEQLRVENVHVLSVTSLSPVSTLDKHPSWTFHLEVLSPKDLRCDHCQVFHFDLGLGITGSLGRNRGVLYGLGLVSVEAGTNLAGGYRVLPEWQLGGILQWAQIYKVQAVLSYFWDLFPRGRQSSFSRFQMNQSWALSQSWEIRWLSQLIAGSDFGVQFYESRIGLNLYF